MLQVIMISMLFIFGFSGIHANEQKTVELMDGSFEDPIIVYLGCANSHLSLGNYQLALEDLNHAAKLLKQSQNPRADLEFLLIFARTVAYDNLNLIKECEKSLDTLIVLCNGIVDSLIEEAEEGENDAEEGAIVLKRMARLASTSAVREILITIVEELGD